jgi:cobalt/nickel transport protein
MKPVVILFAGLLVALAVSTPARAHFQVILPSTDIVADPSEARLTVDLVFTHPMEGGPAMEMVRPVRFGVAGPDGVEDLLPRLEPRPVDGSSAWRASYTLAEPGNYVLFVEPRPYWEPSEGKMIVHYAKVVVDGFGWGDGWDSRVGFPVEIRPLVRPYGLWTGNIFRGVVERGGEPVPFAEVEVEWLNDGSVQAPSDPFVTQVIRADANGVFSYAMPKAGWWGFAALLEAEETLSNPDGEAVPVEEGGLIWVRTVDMD